MVQELDLRANQIGPAGAKAVEAMAAVVGSLTSINLAWNQLGVEGAKALVEGGAFMASLTRLDVSWNSLGGEGEAVLRNAIKGRSGFELKL